MENKRQRFERLAEKRTNEAIHRIRLIGNLANRNNYDFSEFHVRQIFDALEGATKVAKEKFSVASPSREQHFRFKG